MAKLVLTLQAQDRATETVQALNREVQVLSKTLSSITVNKNLTAQINALTRHYNALVNAQSKITANANKQAIADEKLNLQQAKTATATAQLAAAQTQADKATQRATTSITKAAKATAQQTEVTDKHKQSLTSMLPQILKWNIAMMAVMAPIRMLKSAISSLNETLVKAEDTVISFQRVVGKGITSETITSGLYKLVQDYGQTFENVQSIALDFARTGLSWDDTIKATEAALLGLNTAELDATDAATGLIAVLQQFNLEADDLETVIDKLNITQDNAAVTTDKLLAALQRTGSAAANANLSLDETVALITALSSATGRSGENLGTALNSLIQYSSKSSALDTFAQLSDKSKDVVESFRKGLTKDNGEKYTILDIWRQVSEEIKNIKTEQADLLDSYFNTADGSALKEALDDELADYYGKMQGVYDTANTFRKNYFIALLGDMDEVEAALGRMDDAAGYSQAQNDDYMKSYTAQLNQVKGQWEYLATQEQGLLTVKKAFLDIGSGMLWLVQHTGGLTATIMAAGTALTFLVGDKAITGIVKLGKSFKSLASPVNNFTKAVEASRAAKQASIAATEAQNTADAIRNGHLVEGITLEQADKNAKELQTAATQKATIATQAWGAAIKTALGIIGLVITGATMLVGIIDSIDQDKAQKEAEWISQVGDEAGKAVDKLANLQNAVDGVTKAYSEYADKIENARKILADENATTEDVAAAKNTLNDIQNTLVESNADYAESIDVINGKLEEQLKLLETLGEEQARKRVEEYLNANSGAIYDAEKYLSDKHTEIKFEEAVGEWEGLFNDAPLEAWLKSLGYDASEQAGLGEGLGSFFTNKKVFKTTLFHEGMTLDEQLELLNNLRAEAAKIDDEQTKNYIDAQLNKAELAITATDAYKNSQIIVNGNNAASDWVERLTLAQKRALAKGELTIHDVKVLLGLEEEQTDEITEQSKKLSDISSKYKDIIERLKEMRDLSKETTELEEKKQAVLEAQKALEAAQNEATVRRFNDTTKQWEWQVDEKAVYTAEENYKKAKEGFSDATYDKLIALFENNEKIENDEVKKIIAEAAPILGEEFAKALYDYFKDKLSVDLNDLKVTENTVEATPDGGKKSAFDSGGIASGMGYMPKATDKPEAVLNPDLTAQILSPVSSERFHRFVRDAGIMFETDRFTRPQPIIERIGGAVDNHIDNSGQINFAGGVNVAAERRADLLEILGVSSLVPNV